MDLTFDDAQEAAFRDELRAWFAANPPGDEPRGDEDAHYAWRRDWQRRLAEGGWAAVHWPRRVRRPRRDADGVGDLLRGARARAARRCRPTCSGLLLAGPTIMAWGTDEQKERYLVADPHRRGDLVPGLHRARRRLGPRVAEDPGGQGRRRVGRHRAEGLDLAARSTRSGACWSPAPTSTRRSTRA